ncbi:autotransporter outer membrane beta-barrel domain-containing protein [Anaerobiospirillum thomasii]|uniref:autotransporter outer membrane beta-barrel domain-containing protein n=1 Tax=Anaerobiospirillum thomasii TaxID=179995 RepID=UPI0011BECF4A|nr:autotransporter outer membrane beta-barrel domain-containing protein [Anaerobiospirillum thomasii]
MNFSNLVNKNSTILLHNDLFASSINSKLITYIDFNYSKASDRFGPNGVLNNKNYYGTIHNLDPNRKLKLDFKETVISEYERQLESHPDIDYFWGDSEGIRFIYSFLREKPTHRPDNKYRFHVADYTAVKNLKLDNGKGVFDYIEIDGGVVDALDKNSVNKENYFIINYFGLSKSEYTLCILHNKFTQKTDKVMEGENGNQQQIDVGHLDVSTDIEFSADGENGISGKDGNKIKHDTLVTSRASTSDLGSINKNSFVGGNGTSGTDGTKANLYGIGGNGGHGGNGGDVEVELVKSAKIATITGKTSVTAQGGNGADGGNGGKGATHHFMQNYNHLVHDGYRGIGGNGGSVDLVGYRAVGEGPGGAGIGVRDAIITLDKVDMTLIGKAGKGAASGTGLDKVVGNTTKLPDHGANGTVRVSGVDVLSGATLHVKDSAKIHTEAHVHDKKDGKAYSLYMKGDGSPFNEKHNASVLEVGGNLDLSSSINVNGKVEKGNGIHLENTVIAFKDDNGGKGQFGSNKTKYYTITTDRVELSGDNAIVFYTDIQSGKGDKVVVTDGFDILKKGKLKIRIHSDASIKDPTEFTGTLNVSGKHTLIDLPDNIGKLPDDVLGRIDSAWKEDNGAVKLSIKADISQDNKFDIVVNGIASTNTNQASNPVETAMINTFLINRMAFLTNSELSERFRMLKKDNSRNYGLWVQNFYKDVDFDVNDKIGLTAHAKLNSSYIGFDTLKSFGEYDAMYGAYAGYSKMKSTLNLFEASSDIKNINVGIYGALAFNTGTYFEGSVHYNHFDSTAKSRIEGGYQGEDSGTLKINSIGTTLAAGHRFNLAYDTVIDAALKFDYKLFMGENFTTKKGLEIIGDTYSTYGLATSVLVGKYLNDRHSLVYVKGEAGYHYSDISSKTSVKDRAKIFSFENPDYDFTYGSMALGVNHRFFNCVDATLEAHNYFLEGSKSDNFGIKAELRYVF